MATLQQVHEKSGEIIDCQNKIESFEYKLSKLSSGSCFSAKLEIQIGDRRSTAFQYLSKEELVSIIKRVIKEEKERLIELQKVYSSLK